MIYVPHSRAGKAVRRGVNNHLRIISDIHGLVPLREYLLWWHHVRKTSALVANIVYVEKLGTRDVLVQILLLRVSGLVHQRRAIYEHYFLGSSSGKRVCLERPKESPYSRRGRHCSHVRRAGLSETNASRGKPKYAMNHNNIEATKVSTPKRRTTLMITVEDSYRC